MEFKFKEGDKVKVINSDDEHGNFEKEFIIEGIINSAPYGIIENPFYVVKDKDGYITYIEKELQLIE